MRDNWDAGVTLAARAKRGQALTLNETHALKAYVGVILLFVTASRPVSVVNLQIVVSWSSPMAQVLAAPRNPPRGAFMRAHRRLIFLGAL